MAEFFTNRILQYYLKGFSLLLNPFLKIIDKYQSGCSTIIRSIIRFHISNILPSTIIIGTLIFNFTPLSAQQFDAPIYFKKRLSTIKEVLILPVNFDCYHLTSGGIREYDYDMTTRSRKLISENVSKILTNQSFSVKTLPENSYFEKCWHPLRHFYSVVNYQILINVYGTHPFPYAVRTFSYTLPPIPDSLLLPSTDAILFIDGFDDCATSRRQKNKGAAAAITAVSVVSVILGGPGFFVSVPSDQTVASCALVDRCGNIIWYYRYRKEGNIEMTERKDVKQFFSTLLHQLRNGGTEK